MTKKKEEQKVEEISVEEKIDALHAYEKGEGVEPTDFTGNEDEAEKRYAQMMGE